MCNALSEIFVNDLSLYVLVNNLTEHQANYGSLYKKYIDPEINLLETSDE